MTLPLSFEHGVVRTAAWYVTSSRLAVMDSREQEPAHQYDTATQLTEDSQAGSKPVMRTFDPETETTTRERVGTIPTDGTKLIPLVFLQNEYSARPSDSETSAWPRRRDYRTETGVCSC